ncbi:hypothetical protein L6Q96_03340 [Candidatus Binatia bacterium]|nr:hypothetical protein [Candidatus Binatia bacterium]
MTCILAISFLLVPADSRPGIDLVAVIDAGRAWGVAVGRHRRGSRAVCAFCNAGCASRISWLGSASAPYTYSAKRYTYSYPD